MSGKDWFLTKKKPLFLIKLLDAQAPADATAVCPQRQTITLGRHYFQLSILRSGLVANEGVVYVLKTLPVTLDARHVEDVLTELTGLLARRGVSALALWIEPGAAPLRLLVALGFCVVGEGADDNSGYLKSTWPVSQVLSEPVKPAIVMGRPNPNMLAQVRALGRCGIPVYCLLTRGEPESIAKVSRYVRGVINRQKASGSEIIADFRALRSELGTAPVLFFGGDYDITLIARIWSEISDLVLPVTDPIVADRFNDKAEQVARVKQAGVPVPESTIFRTPEDLSAIKGSMNFPLICRPVELSRRGGFRGKIMVVRDQAELERRLRPVLEQGGADILVQEYIPGGDETLFFALAACGPNGEVRSMVTGRKLFQYPEGLMCTGETQEIPELNALTCQSFRALGLGGVLGVEFKRDPRTGTYYYIEANFRPENTGGIAEGAGVNIMLSAYLEAAMEKPWLYSAALARPTTWWDFSLLVLGRLSGERPKVMPRKDNYRVDAVWALDDPLPAIAWYLCKIWRVIAGKFNR